MKTKQAKRILSVTIHREVDTDPDLSHLGEYSNQPEELHIDRQERGDCGRGEYRYFNSSGNYKGEPPADQKKYLEQDYARMEDYNRQGWCMVGVWAEAQVKLTGDVVQRIRSGGLWGIESDSESAYFDEVKQEELAGLRAELEALGFTAKAIKKAFAEAKDTE